MKAACDLSASLESNRILCWARTAIARRTGIARASSQQPLTSHEDGKIFVAKRRAVLWRKTCVRGKAMSGNGWQWGARGKCHCRQEESSQRNAGAWTELSTCHDTSLVKCSTANTIGILLGKRNISHGKGKPTSIFALKLGSYRVEGSKPHRWLMRWRCFLVVDLGNWIVILAKRKGGGWWCRRWLQTSQSFYWKKPILPGSVSFPVNYYYYCTL